MISSMLEIQMTAPITRRESSSVVSIVLDLNRVGSFALLTKLVYHVNVVRPQVPCHDNVTSKVVISLKISLKTLIQQKDRKMEGPLNAEAP